MRHYWSLCLPGPPRRGHAPHPLRVHALASVSKNGTFLKTHLGLLFKIYLVFMYILKIYRDHINFCLKLNLSANFKFFLFIKKSWRCLTVIQFQWKLVILDKCFFYSKQAELKYEIQTINHKICRLEDWSWDLYTRVSANAPKPTSHPANLKKSQLRRIPRFGTLFTEVSLLKITDAVDNRVKNLHLQV